MQLVKLSVGAVLAALASASAPAGAPPLATEIVAQGLSAPTYATFAPGDPSRVYVIEQGGVIKVVKDGVLQATPFLDISAIVPNETFNGLIGIAFHPDFETNGFFYLHHPLGASQFSSNRLALVRYTATSADIADPASRDEIMVLDYPSLPGHHVGGWIGFDDAGYLRIGLGDGGTTGQENPGGARSQSLDSPWGKILRIDVAGDDFPADPDLDFTAPPDNPFVPRLPPPPGVAAWASYVWALGVRQPYRCNFDRETGDFWIADVGLNQREEINFQAASSAGGENYGWSCMEGTICRSALNCSCADDPLVMPFYEYDHTDGSCSLSGSAIYRGCAVPGLEGTYFFGDWCSRKIWSFRNDGGAVADFTDRTAELDPPGGATFGSILGISEDYYGEILICDSSRVYRVTPATGITDENGNGIADECECTGDLDGDGQVGFTDLTTLLAAWGPCGAPCPEDLDGSGDVGFTDLTTLLAAWGPC